MSLNMWKILVSLIFVVVNAGSVEELYGSWVPVAFYPVTTYIPTCRRVSFAKDDNNIQCTCADGKNTTMLEFSLPGQSAERLMFPVLAVEAAGDVAPALNGSCRCGDIEYRNRKVAVVISNNYFVLYETQNSALFTETETSAAQIFAREIPTFAELRSAMKSVNDMVKGNSGIMCTLEYFDAEVRYKALRRQGLPREGMLRSLRVQNFT